MVFLLASFCPYLKFVVFFKFLCSKIFLSRFCMDLDILLNMSGLKFLLV